MPKPYKVSSPSYDWPHFDTLVEHILAGNTILYPTDTIWGLGCDATNRAAVEKVNKLKNRTPDKPYILLVKDLGMLREYVEEIHPKVETLLSFHQRPLTVIYEQGKNLPSISKAKDGSVGIRVVKDPFCQDLLQAVNKPLIATSANISGTPFPKNFGEISSEVLSKVDCVARLRQEEKVIGTPSVLIRVNANDDIVFLRT